MYLALVAVITESDAAYLIKEPLQNIVLPI